MGFLSNIFGRKKAEANASVDFEVSMSCVNCVKHIQTALSDDKAIVDVDIDLESKTVSIGYDNSMTDEAELKNEIENLGFTVLLK